MLPGAHRVQRGAEIAIESVAAELAADDDVTLFGSGPARPDRPYHYVRAGLIPRERFERIPTMPPFRSDYIYEEATWAAAMLRHYHPADFELTVTCSFPFVNQLATRRPGHRPPHVFVTQNGDFPALSDKQEYRAFRCDGLVCTNPLYFERQRLRWRSALIPNGIDPTRFTPGRSQRAALGLPTDVPIVLMVSALIDSKRVLQGMAAVATVPDVHFVVAGNGPLRDEFDAIGERLMPGRAHRLTLPAEQMPDLYRSVDVMLHMTYFESFGNIYIEAAASGIPVVAHDSESTRWILGDDSPGLIDTDDQTAVVAALHGALSTDAEDLGKRSHAARQRFAWSTVAAQYRTFFDEVVGA